MVTNTTIARFASAPHLLAKHMQLGDVRKALLVSAVCYCVRAKQNMMACGDANLTGSDWYEPIGQHLSRLTDNQDSGTHFRVLWKQIREVAEAFGRSSDERLIYRFVQEYQPSDIEWDLLAIWMVWALGGSVTEVMLSHEKGSNRDYAFLKLLFLVEISSAQLERCGIKFNLPQHVVVANFILEAVQSVVSP